MLQGTSPERRGRLLVGKRELGALPVGCFSPFEISPSPISRPIQIRRAGNSISSIIEGDRTVSGVLRSATLSTGGWHRVYWTNPFPPSNAGTGSFFAANGAAGGIVASGCVTAVPTADGSSPVRAGVEFLAVNATAVTPTGGALGGNGGRSGHCAAASALPAAASAHPFSAEGFATRDAIEGGPIGPELPVAVASEADSDVECDSRRWVFHALMRGKKVLVYECLPPVGPKQVPDVLEEGRLVAVYSPDCVCGSLATGRLWLLESAFPKAEQARGGGGGGAGAEGFAADAPFDAAPPFDAVPLPAAAFAAVVGIRPTAASVTIATVTGSQRTPLRHRGGEGAVVADARVAEPLGHSLATAAVRTDGEDLPAMGEPAAARPASVLPARATAEERVLVVVIEALAQYKREAQAALWSVNGDERWCVVSDTL
ncbi:unnamed protein product [Phaeothamnion confervicola]